MIFFSRGWSLQLEHDQIALDRSGGDKFFLAIQIELAGQRIQPDDRLVKLQCNRVLGRAGENGLFEVRCCDGLWNLIDFAVKAVGRAGG